MVKLNLSFDDEAKECVAALLKESQSERLSLAEICHRFFQLLDSIQSVPLKLNGRVAMRADERFVLLKIDDSVRALPLATRTR